MKPSLFKPPNKTTEKILERLMLDKSVKIDTRVAVDFGRIKRIRELRELDKVFIAHDSKKRKSIIFFDGVKPRKEKNGFYFDYIL
jgi:hypothetical protein